MTLQYSEEEPTAFDTSNKKTTFNSDIYWRVNDLQIETILFLQELDTLLNEFN